VTLRNKNKPRVQIQWFLPVGDAVKLYYYCDHSYQTVFTARAVPLPTIGTDADRNLNNSDVKMSMKNIGGKGKVNQPMLFCL